MIADFFLKFGSLFTYLEPAQPVVTYVCVYVYVVCSFLPFGHTLASLGQAESPLFRPLIWPFGAEFPQSHCLFKMGRVPPLVRPQIWPFWGRVPSLTLFKTGRVPPLVGPQIWSFWGRVPPLALSKMGTLGRADCASFGHSFGNIVLSKMGSFFSCLGPALVLSKMGSLWPQSWPKHKENCFVLVVVCSSKL